MFLYHVQCKSSNSFARRKLLVNEKNDLLDAEILISKTIIQRYYEKHLVRSKHVYSYTGFSH